MTIELELPGININRLKEAPIHLFKHIQPHGVLLVLEEPDLKILQISNNTWSIFGIHPEIFCKQNWKTC